MQVDISFVNAKVYNIERFDVVIGQKFSLFTDSGIPLSWFANNDQVLNVIDNDSSADVEATGLGKSIILIMDATVKEGDDPKVVKKLIVNVVNAIVEQAKNLNATGDKPILKDAAPKEDGSLSDLLQ